LVHKAFSHALLIQCNQPRRIPINFLKSLKIFYLSNRSNPNRQNNYALIYKTQSEQNKNMGYG
jgi:hypothetical protein